jgi:hypothetical protein
VTISAVKFSHGYQVVAPTGRAVGKVVNESQAVLVVEVGSRLRRSWRALPKRYASIDATQQRVLMQVSPQDLDRSPSVRPDVPVDEELITRFWGLDAAR